MLQAKTRFLTGLQILYLKLIGIVTVDNRMILCNRAKALCDQNVYESTLRV